MISSDDKSEGGAVAAPDADAVSVRMRVLGMDCASCASKVETALKRLPGVSNAAVNYGAELLSFELKPDRTSREAVESQIRELGYTPEPLDGPDRSHGPMSAGQYARSAQPWWRTDKGKSILLAAGLFATAFAVDKAAPAFGFWAYGIAAAVALLPFARRAFAGAVAGTPFSIETLMTVAAVGAIAIGAAEEAAAVVLLFAIGELLENVAAGRARAGIKALMEVVPRKALIEKSGAIAEILVSDVRIDDIAVVRPGDRVPSDGVVMDGVSEVDEAPITGESVPVPKSIGDTVLAGSINSSTTLRVRITRTAADNTITRIIHLVEEAQGSKSPTARMIDRISAYYTPAAMLVALSIVVLPPLIWQQDWMTWVYRGLAVLLIACPCALVISTPAAIASALAAAARRGLWSRVARRLETIGKIRSAAFDKTGTLTAGHPKVTDVVAIAGSEADLIAQAAAVERGSSHPVAIAITVEAERLGVSVPASFGGATAMPGKGVRARLRSGFVAVGSPNYAQETIGLDDRTKETANALERQGKTVVAVIVGEQPGGLIAVRDEPRPSARAAVERLRRLGVATVMLTGDNARTGQAIAEVIGIDVRAHLMPEDKLRAIEEMKRIGPVAMIGDGINDAPALATASVGIAMGAGTDVALETADAALLRNDVSGIADLVELSRATLRNISQNVSIALGLKLIFLATTVTGTTTLWMAILADTGATVLVTANALRLLAFKPREI